MFTCTSHHNMCCARCMVRRWDDAERAFLLTDQKMKLCAWTILWSVTMTLHSCCSKYTGSVEEASGRYSTSPELHMWQDSVRTRVHIGLETKTCSCCATKAIETMCFQHTILFSKVLLLYIFPSTYFVLWSMCLYIDMFTEGRAMGYV